MTTEWVKRLFSGKVSVVRILFGVITTKTKNLFVNANPCVELLCVFAETNPKKSGFVSSAQFMLILAVFGSRCFSEIVKSVIRSVSVYVIDVFPRKAAIDVQKSESVRPIGFTINPDCDVPTAVKMAGDSTNLDAEGWRFVPSEQTSIKAIVQNFAQSFGENVCRIFRSHDAPPVRWDQGPGRVSSACLASPY